jgi:hypothetical protein
LNALRIACLQYLLSPQVFRDEWAVTRRIGGTLATGSFKALPVALAGLFFKAFSKAGRNPPTGQAVSRKVFNQPTSRQTLE